MSRALKVAMLLPRINPLWIDASQVIIRNLVKALSPYVKIYVVVSADKRTLRATRHELGSFFSEVENGIILNVNTYGIHEQVWLASICKNLCEEEKIDIIHEINMKGYLWILILRMLKMKTPIIHQIYERNRQQWLGNVLGVTHRRFYSGIIATSSEIIDWLGLSGLPNNKCWKVSPPIDTNFFKPVNDNSCQDIIKLLHIGSLKESRFPIKVVLQTIKLLINEYGIDVRLHVVTRPWKGELELTNYSARIAHNLGLSEAVKFECEVLSIDRRKKLYNSTDIFLTFPTASDSVSEPPITALESMSCGVPVIATNTKSLPSIVNNKVNGILVERVIPDVLADAIFTVFQKKREYGFRARTFIEEGFSFKAVSEKLLEVYYNVLSYHT